MKQKKGKGHSLVSLSSKSLEFLTQLPLSLSHSLAIILVEIECLCNSFDEAAAISESIENDLSIMIKEDENRNDDEKKKEEILLFFENLLMDYLDVDNNRAKKLIEIVVNKSNCNNTNINIDGGSGEDNYDDKSDNQFDDKEYVKDDNNDNDGEWIGEGECELCERYIRLTKHHLIPRSTWPKIEKKCIRAIDAIKKDFGDNSRAKLMLGDGLAHLLDQITITQKSNKTIESITTTATTKIRGSKTTRRRRRQGGGDPKNTSTMNSKNDAIQPSIIMCLKKQTCNICRPCHNAIHSRHDNDTLAIHYNTVEKLLTDDQIYKFAKWASKQQTGKYTRNTSINRGKRR